MPDLYISWDEYNKKIEQLAIQVYQDGWKFNQVVCIAKGGLRIGDIFSRLLMYLWQFFLLNPIMERQTAFKINKGN